MVTARDTQFAAENCCFEASENLDKMDNLSRMTDESTVAVHLTFSPKLKMWNEPPKDDATKLLTDEILLKIFLFLSKKSLCRVSKVCTRWNNLSNDRSLWKEVNLSSMAPPLKEYDLQILLQTKMAHTNKLNVGSTRLTFKTMQKISAQCKNLRVLIFGRNSSIEQTPRPRRRVILPKSINTLDIRQAVGSFEFLTDMDRTFFNIINIGIGPNSFTKLTMPFLFNKLPNLVIADFTNCSELDDENVRALSKACPTIESLCLIGCRNIRGSSLSTLIKYCWNLKTLLLRYLKIEDDILVQNFWRESVIEELDISACPHVTWQGLYLFLAQLKHLNYLNMSYCGEGHAVNDIVLFEMLNNGIAERLQMLDLRWSFHITPHALDSFMSKCQQLEYFGLYQSINVKADNMASLLVYTPKMKILEYGGSFPQELHSSNIIPTLMSSAKELEVLSLINFASVATKDDQKSLETLMQNNHHLKRINFCDCSPELVRLGQRAVSCMKNVKVTVKWECALPPPLLTLDSIVL